MTLMTNHQRNKKAFTLVELLVVIAIIALLLAILIPALSTVRQQAGTVACRSNIKQLATALSMYEVEYNNRTLDSKGGGDFWFTQIAPYLGEREYKKNPEEALESSMKVLFCPQTREPIALHGGSWGSAKNRWRYHVSNFGAEGSYALNAWVGGWNMEEMIAYGVLAPEDQGISFRGIPPGRPDIPVFCDAIWVDTLPQDKQEVPFDLQYPLDDFGFGRICIDRHKMAINVSFADGHGERVKLEDLWKLRWNRIFNPTKVKVPAE